MSGGYFQVSYCNILYHTKKIWSTLIDDLITVKSTFNTYYHSFGRPNVCLAQLQIDFVGPQIYLQPAKIKSQYFGVSMKFLACY